MADYTIDDTKSPAVVQVSANYLAVALSKLGKMYDVLSQFPNDVIMASGPVAFDMVVAGKNAVEVISALPDTHPLKKQTDLPLMQKGIAVMESGKVKIVANGPPAPSGESVLEIIVQE